MMPAMRAIAIALLLVGGCKHAAVGISNAHPAAPVPGALQINAVAPVSAAIIVGTVAAAAAVSEASSPSPGPNYSMFSDWTARPVPPMAAEREVGLQDCTRPIDLSAGNLRCR